MKPKFSVVNVAGLWLSDGYISVALKSVNQKSKRASQQKQFIIAQD